MKRSFIVYTLLYLCIHYTSAQESAREHQVVKGETVYQISRIYNVTVNEIFQLNPEAVDGINVGDRLIIPNSKQDANTGYIVRPGETKYGLSKQFGVTIKELEDQNPHIVNGLQAGHRLQLAGVSNTTNSTPSTTSTNTSFSSYRTHVVLKGETLYGISRANGLTVDQLVAINSDVISGVLKTGIRLRIPTDNQSTGQALASTSYVVKKGDTKFGLSKRFNVSIQDLESANPQIVDMLRYGTTILIPSQGSALIENENIVQDTAIDEDTATQETTIVETPEPVQKDIVNSLPSNTVDLTKSIDQSTKRILFVTPYTNSEISSYSSNSPSDGNRSIKQFVAFYRGAQIAIDSARSIGLTFELNLEPISSLKNRFKVNDPLDEIQDFNLIFSPYNGSDTEQIAIAALRANIPVVTTSTKQESRSLANLFEALPSLDAKRKATVDYLIRQNGNIVVLNDIDRTDTQNYINQNAPDATFIKMTKRGSFKESELSEALVKDKTNYVLINSDKNRVFLNATNILLSESTSYAIQLVVIDTNLLPGEEYVSAKRYKVLNMIYPSNLHVDNTDALNRFNKKFYNTYRATATDDAIYGFDIMFDTLLRICQAEGYMPSAKKDITEYTLLNFNYKLNGLERYSNSGVTISKYQSNSDID